MEHLLPKKNIQVKAILPAMEEVILAAKEVLIREDLIKTRAQTTIMVSTKSKKIAL